MLVIRNLSKPYDNQLANKSVRYPNYTRTNKQIKKIVKKNITPEAWHADVLVANFQKHHIKIFKVFSTNTHLKLSD